MVCEAGGGVRAEHPTGWTRLVLQLADGRDERASRLTDTQLYLAIGIPSALFALNFVGVLAAAFWQTKRFDDLKDLFKAELGRVEGELKAELRRVDGVLGAKIDGLTVRVKALEDEIHSPLVKQC